MIITDKELLKKYNSEYRLWQGIPSIEVTEKGRIFLTFYSGGTKEQYGNYVILVKSDDGGETFSEPVAAAYKDEDHRCFDPVVWIDPTGRLWLIWAVMPSNGVYASVCDNPDAEILEFSEPRKIGEDVMMCRPTVLSTGEWLFPIAVWKRGIIPHTWQESKIPDSETGAFLYKTSDNGETFKKLGGTRIDGRWFDEHMSLELSDGTVRLFARCTYGIGAADSHDRGKTFGPSFDTGYKGPCSRFHITRLSSGRVLLINHYNYKSRDNLYALLSEDDGKTFKYKLLLDERSNVSYPDAVERDGYIYITYDRERGGFMRSLSSTMCMAREVLIAKITEEDIINGSLVSDGYLKRVASKLGECKLPDAALLYDYLPELSVQNAVKVITEKYTKEKYLDAIFEAYSVNCANMHKLDFEKLDALAEKLRSEDGYTDEILEEIVSLVSAVSERNAEPVPIVERVKAVISENITENLSASQIAEKIGISRYYMSHLFKKATSLSIAEYKNELRITLAKKLLVSTNDSITNIAYACGFSTASYFSERFSASEGILPTKYRAIHKKP